MPINVGAGDCAASVQLLGLDRTGEPIRFDPADGRSGVIKDEQPAVGRRGTGGTHPGAQPNGRLVAQRQGRRAPEPERAIAPVAPHEVCDKVVHRVGKQPSWGVQLREAPAHPQHRDLVAEFDRLVDVVGWHEPWRALTGAFLHSPSTVLHLGLNMLMLWQIGPYLESLLGRARFLALYLVSAVGGSAGVMLLAAAPRAILVTAAEAAKYGAWATPVVGASGAVFGLFGALLVLNRHLGRSSTALYAVLGVNIVFGFVYPGISWQAHVGGLVTGVAVAGVIALLGHRERRTWQWPAIALVFALVLAAMVVDYLGVPDIYR